MTGLLGFSSGYHALMNCDTLLMLGTDFPYRQFLPKEATVVQIDVRGEQLGRRSKVDFGFVGDTKTTLRALLPRLKQNEHEAHLKESLDIIERPARVWTSWQSAIPAGHPSIHNMSPASSIDLLPTMLSSLSMSEHP
jgi:pyruvate dehydrogenase (quinone)